MSDRPDRPKSAAEVEQAEAMDTTDLADRLDTVEYEQDKANEVICCAQPGDLLAHQAMTIHWAGANNSPTRSRRALGFIFYGVSAREDAAAHKAYQQKLDSELAASGKI